MSSGHSPPSTSIHRRAFRGTLLTFILRILSFVCTQWTIRHVDPEAFGRASIPLELLLTTVLFTSREGFRLALTKNHTEKEDEWNIAWLCIPVTTVMSLLALTWHLHRFTKDSPPEQEDKDYKWAGMLYCLAACIEGWAEPCVLHALRQLNVAVKAFAEAIATVAKTVVTVLALQYLNEHYTVSAFGIAQVAYAIVYAIVLYVQVGSSLKGPVLSSAAAFPSATIYMVFVFTVQGLFKHLLTEGDKIVLTSISESYNQGMYAMGMAYGGMAARILLQPIEENGRLLFGRLSAQLARDKSEKQVTPSSMQLLQSYTVLVKLVLYVGLIFSCLGVNYTSILLNVLAGRKWANHPEAATVLSGFCVYTAFLALNGITEAFVYGVASSAGDMGRLGMAHTGIAVVFACAAPAAVKHFGTIGLVAANCFSMLLRSIYSIIYATNYFAQRHDGQWTWALTLLQLMRGMLPHWFVLMSFGVSFAATRASLASFATQVVSLQAGTRAWYKFALQHIGVGAACGIGILSLAYLLERPFRTSITTMLRKKQD